MTTNVALFRLWFPILAAQSYGCDVVQQHPLNQKAPALICACPMSCFSPRKEEGMTGKRRERGNRLRGTRRPRSYLV